MNITHRTDKDILYISIEGRVDASNATEVEDKIFAIRKEHTGCHTVIDADTLEYISSAGLRVILRLRKEEPSLAIINVSAEVYEVLEMTGFTEMVTVEKAFRRISVEGCEFIAKGANGAVYRYDDETIVKVYFAKDALPDIQQERENARKAFVLGVNTAIPYGIVRVGEGYGMVTELLNAKSITKLIRENPENLDLPVKYFVDMLKSIHSTKAEEGAVPNIHEKAIGWIDYATAYLPEDKINKLRSLIEDLPVRNTLMHGDYHTNNIMIQNGEPVLIDMDTLCMGHPIFELGPLFNAYVGFAELNHQNIMDFFGFDFDTGSRFLKLTIKSYLDTDDESYCDSVMEKAMIVGYLRILRRSVRRPNDPESAARIPHCAKRLSELLDKVDTLDF